MKDKIYDLISKILSFYESKGEISMQKLAFIIYLCDWKNSMDNENQITNIKWKYIDRDFSKNIIDAFEKGQEDKNSFSFKSNYTKLSKKELETIETISKLSLKLDTDDFIKLVYSTFPMIKKERNIILDLPDLAKEYKSDYEYM